MGSSLNSVGVVQVSDLVARRGRSCTTQVSGERTETTDIFQLHLSRSTYST